MKEGEHQACHIGVDHKGAHREGIECLQELKKGVHI